MLLFLLFLTNPKVLNCSVLTVFTEKQFQFLRALFEFEKFNSLFSFIYSTLGCTKRVCCLH